MKTHEILEKLRDYYWRTGSNPPPEILPPPKPEATTALKSREEITLPAPTEAPPKG